MKRHGLDLMARPAIAGLALLGLAACGTNDPIRSINYANSPDSDYTRDFMQWAGSSGPVLIELRDNPFPIGAAVVARTIAEASNGAPSGGIVTFTANPADAARPEWRVVYSFYPGSAVTSAQLCDESRQLAHRPQEGRLEVLVAFCNERYVIGSVGISAPPIAPGDTVGLAQLAERGMTDLLQPGKRGNDYPDKYPRRSM